MTIDEWARREAEEVIPAGGAFGGRPPSVPHAERIRFADGIVHALNALLSDDAVEAAADQMLQWANLSVFEARRPDYLTDVRTAIQAAIDAVTKGDTQ